MARLPRRTRRWRGCRRPFRAGPAPPPQTGPWPRRSPASRAGPPRHSRRRWGRSARRSSSRQRAPRPRPPAWGRRGPPSRRARRRSRAMPRRSDPPCRRARRRSPCAHPGLGRSRPRSTGPSHGRGRPARGGRRSCGQRSPGRPQTTGCGAIRPRRRARACISGTTRPPCQRAPRPRTRPCRRPSGGAARRSLRCRAPP